MYDVIYSLLVLIEKLMFFNSFRGFKFLNFSIKFLNFYSFKFSKI